MENKKTANKLYKEYRDAGGTLSFKAWVDREKRKGFLSYEGDANIPVNKPLNDSIQNAVKDLREKGGYTEDLQNNYIFGVHRNVWMITGGLVVASLAVYIIYRKTHKS